MHIYNIIIAGADSCVCPLLEKGVYVTRIMGLDVGDKTIGVALSDPLGWTAQGLETIRRIGIKRFAKAWEVIEEYNVNKIVVGLPKNRMGQ